MAIRTRISASEITEKVSHLCMDANFNLNEDVLDAMRDSYEAEVSPVAEEVFEELLENAKIARECQMPIKQARNLAVHLFGVLKILQQKVPGLFSAINEGVR